MLAREICDEPILRIPLKHNQKKYEIYYKHILYILYILYILFIDFLRESSAICSLELITNKRAKRVCGLNSRFVRATFLDENI